MVTLHEVITFLISMEISISRLQTHNGNRCGRSRHLARKLSLRRKRSSPNVLEMAATETITSIILIKLIRVSLGTVRHPRRFRIVVIDIQITLKQTLRDFIGIRVNRAKKSGMVNILSRVSLGTVRHLRRFKIVVIDSQISLKQLLRDFIGIRVNRAKDSGMVNISSSVNSRERGGLNTIPHELRPRFTINVPMRDIKS